MISFCSTGKESLYTGHEHLFIYKNNGVKYAKGTTNTRTHQGKRSTKLGDIWTWCKEKQMSYT